MNNFLIKENREKLQIMSNLVRYNNTTHIHDEDVAEHSFYVAFYTMQLCDCIGIKGKYKELAICYALIHDVHEIILSDIPHNTKEMIPELGRICSDYEKTFNKSYFPEIVNELDQISEEDSELIKFVVVLADTLSVKQYAIQECKYGNVEHYEEIENNANSRVRKIISAIEKIRGEAVGMILSDMFREEL